MKTRSVLNTIGLAGIAVALAGSVLTIVAACSPGTPPESKPHTPATPAAATTPALTSAQQKFVSDFTQAQPGAVSVNGAYGNTPDQVAQLGTEICSSLGSGASASTVESTLTTDNWHQPSQILQLAETDICPEYETKVLASFSGSGDQTTGQFTIGGNGNWVLNWTYNCSSFGTSGNFIVSEDDGNDGAGASVNELGNGSSGQTNAYSDSGTHTFSIISECSWTLQVVGSPAS